MVLLPLVLAGPILRRCEKNAVYVWLATSEDLTKPITDNKNERVARKLELCVYKNPNQFAGITQNRSGFLIGGNRSQKDSISEKRAGDLKLLETTQDEKEIYFKANPLSGNLFIYLLRATPYSKENLPLGVTLGYEIYLVEERFNGEEIIQTRFGISYMPNKDDSKADPDRALYTRGYSDDSELSQTDSKLRFEAEYRSSPLLKNKSDQSVFEIPTFIIQSSNEKLRFWAGSCFKVHAAPPSATLKMYTDSSLENRPHALFLMGDQIYADDVPYLLARHISALGEALVGKEILPIEDSPTPQDLDAEKRRALFKALEPAFKQDDGVENQLITFGEFAAYYLMHFNPALWPDLKKIRNQMKRKISFIDSEKKFRRLNIEFDRLLENRKALKHFAATLANTPTYMICDDHEITDDLFFDTAWIDKINGNFPKNNNPVKTGNIGTFIINNGAIAYSLFQAVGNTANESSFSTQLSTLANSNNLIETLNTIRTHNWSYITPTNPPALFLDTRFSRNIDITQKIASQSYYKKTDENGFEEKKLINAPQFSMNSFSNIKTLINESKVGSNILIVTPSPILGSDKLEEFKINRKDNNKYKADYEGWRANLSNYFLLIDLLYSANLNKCVVFGGDVHYGYTRSVEFRKFDTFNLDNKPLYIQQIVSSPLLNPFETQYGNTMPLLQSIGTNYLLKQEDEIFLRYSFLPEASTWKVEAIGKYKNPNKVDVIFGKYYEEYTNNEYFKTSLSESKKQTDVVVGSHFFEIEIDRAFNLTKNLAILA